MDLMNRRTGTAAAGLILLCALGTARAQQPEPPAAPASAPASPAATAAAPAPPKIAHQIYTQAVQTKMIVRYAGGEAMEKTLAWAESEVEGFMRT